MGNADFFTQTEHPLYSQSRKQARTPARRQKKSIKIDFPTGNALFDEAKFVGFPSLEVIPFYVVS